MAYISKTEKVFRASRLNTNFQISMFKQNNKSTPKRNANEDVKTFYASSYEAFLRNKFGSKWIEHL